jgi:hypothetical protein
MGRGIESRSSFYVEKNCSSFVACIKEHKSDLGTFSGFRSWKKLEESLFSPFATDPPGEIVTDFKESSR